MSIFLSFLQEADRADFNAKLLIRCTNIHRSNVNDGQAGCFRCLVVDDCLAPWASVWLCRNTNETHLITWGLNSRLSRSWFTSAEKTHRAAVLADAVCEAAVALGSDLDIVGSLEQQGLLQVSGGGVHVGNAVLAVVCDVLRGLVGHQAHEGHLDVDILRIGSIHAILELQWWREENHTWVNVSKVRRLGFVCLSDFSPGIHRSWTRWTRRASSLWCSCWGTSSSWGC